MLFLRFLAYGITLALTIVTTTMLLYVALGYRFDQSGHVVQNGLLLVDNRPAAARILLNGKERDNAAPGRFVLSAGEYNLELQREGYRPWQKDITIGQGRVRTVRYPILLPEKLQPENVRELREAYLISQSLDKKQLLLHSVNAAQFELITLSGDTEKHERTVLPFGAAMPKEGTQTGTFKVIEWALNDKQVLLEQTLPSGTVNLLSYDIRKPEEVVNISDLYSDVVPENIHYVGGRTSMIYGLRGDVLQRLSLEEAEATTVLSGVRQYQPYSDTTVAYDRVTSEGVEIGVWHEGEATTIHTYPADNPPAELLYFQYDDHFYLVTTNTAQTEVVVYRDPIKKPILSSQLPFITLDLTLSAQLSISPSSQFLLIQQDDRSLVYDFEDTKQYVFTIEHERAAGTIPKWITGEHLLVQTVDGANYMFEYDGGNQQLLQTSKVGYPAFFTGDMEGMYEVATTKDGATYLRMTPLVVD